MVQVEELYNPQLKGQPIAVMQYNPFGDLCSIGPEENRVLNDSNGSIIALGYGAARKAGVKRNMRGAEARKLCPELQLVQVPVCNGKSDLTTYRHHGQAVLDLLARDYDGVGAPAALSAASPCTS
jgi:DNA polymerase eta